MLCKEIMTMIETHYPKNAALSFDNVGLLAGRSAKEVKCVYLALDATDNVIRHAEEVKADLLITHHPLLFAPMKQINDEDFIGRRIVRLIQDDISYYAMHTNYDVLGMAQLAGKILSLTDAEVLDVTAENDGEVEGIGRVGTLPVEMSLEECCAYVKNRLGLDAVKVFGETNKQIKRLAISPGSGKSAVIPAVQKEADVLVTGDIGHHDGLDAVEQGLAVIDAGHYGTEYIFLEDMKAFFAENLPQLKVVTEPVVHPFQII